MTLPDSLYRELEKITGSAGITTDPEELVCYSFDATARSFLPDIVVFPSSTLQVSKILELATRHSVCVTPRGSGSGMTGGTLPVKGGIVMVMTRMNRIVEIDTENLVARVEPGVVTGDLHRAAEKQGLFYPPDPASSAFCTIGGNIGECAGGPRAVKYGVTRDYVLGLEAVLPSGQIIKTGVSTAKGVAGYDLTRLIVGSEGTLAVVTGIILRLVPLPEAVKTMSAVFNSMKTAAETVSGIIRESVVPRCIEFVDRASIDCVREDIDLDLSSDVRAILIIEVDGTAQTVAADTVKLERYCLDKGASTVVIAQTPAEAKELWKARKALSPALFKIASGKLNEDIVVPISRIPEMVARIESIQERSGLTIVSFGHAGDGNIHCNIMYDKRDKDQLQRAEAAVDELFDATLALGGTITGEHGVGITKQKYLSREIGDTELAVMKGIKKVFDPGNLLNPGKIF
ncbi:MAG: FAD-binding protein [Desulfobacterium sp.]|nr:FAD-binding protein [Desulfobacterium sp.]